MAKIKYSDELHFLFRNIDNRPQKKNRRKDWVSISSNAYLARRCHMSSLEMTIFSWRALCPATSSVCRTKFSNIMFQLWALAISDIFHILHRLTVDWLGFHDTIHWKRAKQVNLRCKATRLAGKTCGVEEVFIVHSSPASYHSGRKQ